MCFSKKKSCLHKPTFAILCSTPIDTDGLKQILALNRSKRNLLWRNNAKFTFENIRLSRTVFPD